MSNKITLPEAKQILEKHRLSYSPDINPRLALAHQLGISAIEILEEIQIRFPALIPNLLLGKAPQIDNQRSLHHIKEVLRSRSGGGGG